MFVKFSQKSKSNEGHPLKDLKGACKLNRNDSFVN